MEDIKIEIKNNLLTKIGTLNSKILNKQWFINSNLYKQIDLKTQFIEKKPNKNNTIAEKIYCVLHDIKECPICPGCNKKLNFKMFKYGYFKTCNNINCKRKNTKWSSCSAVKKKQFKNILNNFINDIEQNNYNLIDILIIKDFIEQRLIDTNIGRKHQLVNYKHIQNYKDLLISILQLTKNLIPINYKKFDWSQRFYIIQNNLKEIPICEFCNTNKRFYISFIKGYQKACNIKCGNSHYASKKRIESHFKEIEQYINKQGFQIINNEDYDGLNKTRLSLKCNKCNSIINKDLSDGKWKDIFCSGCFGNKNISKDEKNITEYIKTVYKEKIEENYKFHKYKNGVKELDIFLPNKNIAIEYNGLYWHSEQHKDKLNLYNKTILCDSENIQLIHIFEDEWLFKEKIVKARLKHILGLVKYSIGARECEIKIIDVKLKNKFLNKYHLQGEDKSAIHLGAYYKNRLVAVMTFGKLRKALGQNAKVGSYELIRFCTISNFNFPGIANKLLNYFEKTYKPKYVISYADRRWSKGNLYKNLNFTFIKYSKPSYWYFKGVKRYHRFNFRKNILKNKLKMFDSNKTEIVNMQANGWNRIWDCGNYVFVKKY